MRLINTLSVCVLSLLFSSICVAGPGGDLLTAAEDFIAIAEYDKALVFADKALAQLEIDLAQSNGKPDLLARGHFVRAYILVAKSKPEAEIKNALREGLSWDESAQVPDEYSGHPVMQKLYAEARGPALGDACGNVTQAQELFTKSDFCGAYAALCSTKGQCDEKSDLEGMIAQVSLDNCPKFQELDGCPAQAKSFKVRSETRRNPAGNGRIGVASIIIKDIRGSIQGEVHDSVLIDALSAGLPSMRVVGIGVGTLEPWATKNDLRNGWRKYVVSEHEIGLVLSFSSLMEEGGANEAVEVGGVPSKYSDALEELMLEQSLEYILFTEAYNPNNGRRMKLQISLYHISDVAHPKMTKLWKNIKKVKDFAKRWDDVLAEVRKAI